MGPRAGLDMCGKSRPPPAFDPRTVQPVASRYTDYATGPTFFWLPYVYYSIELTGGRLLIFNKFSLITILSVKI